MAFLGNLSLADALEVIGDFAGAAGNAYDPRGLPTGEYLQRLNRNKLYQRIMRQKADQEKAEEEARRRVSQSLPREMDPMHMQTSVNPMLGRPSPELEGAPRNAPEQRVARTLFGSGLPEFQGVGLEMMLDQFSPERVTVSKPGDIARDSTGRVLWENPAEPKQDPNDQQWRNAIRAAGGDPNRPDTVSPDIEAKAREILYLNVTGGNRAIPQATPYVSRLTGNPVRLNAQTGSYMDGELAVDPSDLMPAADFNKDVEASRGILGEIGQAQELESVITANPGAFDKKKVNMAAAKSLVPIYGNQLAAETFSEEENSVRARVAQNAAAIINKLYGAALSAGEDARASTFVPDKADTLETLIPKLRAAVDWAESKRKGLLPSAVARAQRQVGGDASAEPAAKVIDFNQLPP